MNSMKIDRNLLLIIIFSLISTIAGIYFYRLIIDKPEFISANRPINVNPEIPSAIDKPQAVAFNDIVLKDLDGHPRHLNEWKNQLLLINFWAPWCPPCIREIPALREIQQAYPEKLQVIGLSFDNSKNVNNFIQDNPVNYPLLLVQEESTMINDHFGNSTRALPFTAILNKQREIIFDHNGEITKEIIDKEINAQL